MTRVRGKEPLELTRTPEVSICHPDSIRIETGGHTGGVPFTAQGNLSASCAARLIVELRDALRKIRRERTAFYERQVLEAEKALP